MNIKLTAILCTAAAIFTLTERAFAENVLTIKIGIAGPLSGSNAHIGKENENGAKMAVEELNARGIIIGGKKAKFKLLAEDDGSDPRQGGAAAQKLVDAKANGVVGHINSSVSIVAAKIYHDAGIPQISPSTTATSYTAMAGYKSTFRLVANDDQLGSYLGGYAAQQLSAKTIAVIDDRSAYGQGIADAFIKGAKRQNAAIQFIQRQYTNDKAVDFNAILTRIKGSKPDVIFFGGMYSVAGPMLRQMKALGMHTPFIGGDGICTPLLADLAGDGIADGQVVCARAGGVIGEQKKVAENFRLAYKKKFGDDLINYGANAYDAVMILANAMQQANSSEPAVYLPFLQKIHHKGIADTQFDQKGDLVNGALTLFSFKSGKRTEIGVVR